MQIASYEIGIEAVWLLVNPAVIAVAAVVGLLLATGTAGRVVLYFEELPHRRAAVRTQLTQTQRSDHARTDPS